MKNLIIYALSLTSLIASTDKLYFNNGKVLDAKILEANETHVEIERSNDLQQFRIKTSMLTKDTQKQIELYHSEDRYSSIPSVKTPVDDRTLKTYASYIDSLIEENLRNKRITKTKELDDSTYIRRLYLTLAGRIPTQSELENFFNDRSSNKKDKLIQKLLNSESYVNHQMNWWSDMLRIKDRINGANINVGGVYRAWLRNSIRENKPYDQIVRDLISSSGRILENEESAAVSYFLRDRGMQEDNLSHTIRIFLGTRLQCAMCHDHPFDRWTQKEFYEMTAFTSGIGNVRINSANKQIGALSRAISADADSRAGLFNNWRNQIRDSLAFGIENNGTGQIKLPRDFAESNGKPGDTVYAKAIFTPKPIFDPKVSDPKSRKILADWITNKDNPRFTTMIANRIWKQIFGAGLIEPIDTMVDKTLASNESLIKYLERIMVSVNYDLKEYQRILLNTKLFQRASKKEDYKMLEQYNFEGPILRRMSGEQLWDSLVTLVYNNIDAPERIYLHSQQDYSPILFKYRDMNGSAIYQDIKKLADENPGERNFLKIINASTGSTPYNKSFPDKNLVRSSYLPSPASGGHLIRQFGGSDREQIDNSSSEPNTPQVLNLLNGFVESNILRKKDADFMKQMQSEKAKTKQIDSVFLSILGREPTIQEFNSLKKIIDKPDGFKHVAWILLNSHEFIFIK
jgi:hypothetical protein